MTVLLRLVLSDIRRGSRQIACRLLACAALVNVLCFMMYTLVASGRTEVASLTFADYVASCFCGIDVRSTQDGGAFKLPAGWLCLCGLLAYIVLDYPSRDLKCVGSHVVAASGSRWHWWLSKCVWVVVMCGVSWAIALASCALWAILAGTGIAAYDSFCLTPEVPALLGFQAPRVATEKANIAVYLFTMLVVLIALCLMQLSVSIGTAPIVGFAAVVTVLLLSALHANGLLLGNHLMLARSDLVTSSGFSCEAGVLLGLAVSVASVVLGGNAFVQRDIFGRSTDAA